MRLKAPAPMWRRTIESRGQCRDHAGAPAPVKGEPGTARPPGAGDRQGAIGAADRVARQVDHQGAAGLLRIRRGCRALRDSQLATSGSGHPQLHQARQAVGRLRLRGAPVLLIDEIDKADIEFPTTCCSSSIAWNIFVYADGRNRQGAAAADRRHHLEQREGIAGRLPAAAVSSTTSAFPTRTRLAAIIEVHFPASSSAWSRSLAAVSTRSATCRA